jgi:hypothetical protein
VSHRQGQHECHTCHIEQCDQWSHDTCTHTPTLYMYHPHSLSLSLSSFAVLCVASPSHTLSVCLVRTIHHSRVHSSYSGFGSSSVPPSVRPSASRAPSAPRPSCPLHRMPLACLYRPLPRGSTSLHSCRRHVPKSIV